MRVISSLESNISVAPAKRRWSFRDPNLSPPKFKSGLVQKGGKRLVLRGCALQAGARWRAQQRKCLRTDGPVGNRQEAGPERKLRVTRPPQQMCQ